MPDYLSNRILIVGNGNSSTIHRHLLTLDNVSQQISRLGLDTLESMVENIAEPSRVIIESGINVEKVLDILEGHWSDASERFGLQMATVVESDLGAPEVQLAEQAWHVEQTDFNGVQ
jgi:hypothetical protein